MAWTTPFTWAPLLKPTATALNASIRDNLLFLFGDPSWTVPTLANSWVSFDGGATYEIPQYCKTGRMVVGKGLMKSGTGIAYTLPTGYRPLKRHQFITSNAAGARTSLIEISANGDVNVAAFGTGGSNAGVGVEFTFIAEQ